MSQLDVDITPVTRLTKGLNLRDVISEGGEFVVENEGSDDEMVEFDLEKEYGLDALAPYVCTDALDIHADESKSFEFIRKEMTPIIDDGKILKKIETQGVGEIVPKKAVVYCHYVFYVEGSAHPYDISYLRHKRPVRLHLGSSGEFLGFHHALRSMKKGEEAIFLIHSDYAYGTFGCPPRIPSNATIMAKVKLQNFCDASLEDDDDDKETKPRTFEDKLKIVKNLHAVGNDYKKNKKTLEAIRSYRKALNLLMGASLKNEEEEEAMKKEAIHLYTNLALCYSEQQNWKRVCIMGNDAYRDCPKYALESKKLLYYCGIALMKIGNYEEAGKRLRQALKVSPHEKLIKKAIDELNRIKQEHLEYERKVYGQCFGFKKDDDNKNEKTKSDEVDDDLPVSETFVRELTSVLQEYKDKPISETRDKPLVFPANFTIQELIVCEQLIKDLGLSYTKTCSEKGCGIVFTVYKQ